MESAVWTDSVYAHALCESIVPIPMGHLYAEADILEVDDGAIVLLQVPSDLNERRRWVLVTQLRNILYCLQEKVVVSIFVGSDCLSNQIQIAQSRISFGPHGSARYSSKFNLAQGIQ